MFWLYVGLDHFASAIYHQRMKGQDLVESLILKDRKEVKLELVVPLSFLAHSTTLQGGCSHGGH